MADIVLFHSVLGQRPAEWELAKAFAADGHHVLLPDLYDGRSTDDYDEAFRIRKEIGHDTILGRAREALTHAPEDAVLAGISYGAYLVGLLWGERPHMPAALLISGPAPWMEPRRAGLPVAAHIAEPDPYDSEDFFAEWAADAGEVAFTLHRYPGAGHYFLNSGLPDYDAAAAEHCLARMRAFLSAL